MELIQFLKNVWEEIKKKITGTYEPTPIRLRFAILILILSVITSAVFGYYSHEFLRKWNAKADVQIYFESEIKSDGIHKYIPLVVENTGNKDLHDIQLLLTTCFMYKSSSDKPIPIKYRIPIVQSQQKIILQHMEEKALREFENKDCSPEVSAIDKAISISFDPADDNSIINYSKKGCGYCYFDANFYSSELNKEFKDLIFRAPVTGIAQVNISNIKGQFKKGLGNVTLTIFDADDLYFPLKSIKNNRMEKTVRELLEEVYKAYPNYVDVDDLVKKGFSVKMIREGYGSGILNYNVTDNSKATLSSQGFLMVNLIRLENAINDFNKSSNRWSFWLTILTSIMLIAVAFQIYLALFYK